MTYRGQVKGGSIVLEGSPSLPEGSEVVVELLDARGATTSGEDDAGLPSDPLAEDVRDARPIWEILAERAAQVPPQDLALLPRDGAEEHDHYIYGTPKRGGTNT